MDTIVLSGPSREAVSGISTHLNQMFGSRLAREFHLLHFQVGSEGRRESAVAKLLRTVASPYMWWRYLRHHRPAIVHINSAMVPKAYWRDLAYVFVSKIVGARVVFQVHGGSLPLDFFGGHWVPTAFLRATLRATDIVVLLSEIDRKGYVALDPDLTLDVVPNAIEVDESLPTKMRNPEAPLRLVYLGRLAVAKGVFEAVEALALLRAEGIEASMAFAGTGPDDSRLRNRVSELALNDRVVFKGVVGGRDKDALWQGADVLVFPSYREGLPYALLEGMATRTVPVICPVGAIPEVMEDGIHGLFVPPKDPVRLAAALKRLHENRAELDALGNAARQRVMERFTVDRLADAFVRIYRNLHS